MDCFIISTEGRLDLSLNLAVKVIYFNENPRKRSMSQNARKEVCVDFLSH